MHEFIRHDEVSEPNTLPPNDRELDIGITSSMHTRVFAAAIIPSFFIFSSLNDMVTASSSQQAYECRVLLVVETALKILQFDKDESRHHPEIAPEERFYFFLFKY